MPVYTYRCSHCGIQFEKQQSFRDESLVHCPECGKKALKKVYLPVGIVFKGSGFYATDHHSPSGQTMSKTDEPASEKTEKKTESSTGEKEVKPETTQEKKENPKS